MTPAEAETTDTDMAVDWDGVTVTLPGSTDDWDPDAVEAFEAGKAVTAIRSLLGTDQYEKIRSAYTTANGRRPTMGDLGRLMDMVAKSYGFTDSGE